MNDLSVQTNSMSPIPPNPLKRILIIEDNPVHRRLMENELRSNYELSFAADSQTALGYIRDKYLSFDLVVLDSLIPPRPGELATIDEALKILSEAMGSIVVVVSGTNTELLKQQLARFNVKRVFEKPFSLTKFQEYVNSLFSENEETSQ